MRKHQYAWCHRNDSHNSPFIAGMKLVFSQNLTEKQRESKSVCVCVSCLVFVFIFAALYNCLWGMETGCHGSGLNVIYSDMCVSV